jgi:heptaprenyl diphosphate synthase
MSDHHPTAMRPKTRRQQNSQQDGEEDDRAVLLRWLRSYISRPSADLGRRGPICPFVPAALDVDAVRFRFRPEVDGRDRGQLRSVLLQEITAFHAEVAPPDGSGRSLASLLVVLPRTGPTGWVALDQLHRELKHVAVQQGLMIGQFHPACDERAVRNPNFPVSRAPVALLAIRHMAPHDLLFLHDQPAWFAAYRQRFPTHMTSGRVRDPLLNELYEAAVRRHGPDGRAASSRRCRVNPRRSTGTPTTLARAHRTTGGTTQ